MRLMIRAGRHVTKLLSCALGIVTLVEYTSERKQAHIGSFRQVSRIQAPEEVTGALAPNEAILVPLLIGQRGLK